MSKLKKEEISRTGITLQASKKKPNKIQKDSVNQHLRNRMESEIDINSQRNILNPQPLYGIFGSEFNEKINTKAKHIDI